MSIKNLRRKAAGEGLRITTTRDAHGVAQYYVICLATNSVETPMPLDLQELHEYFA